jgi:hypothetical protein
MRLVNSSLRTSNRVRLKSTVIREELNICCLHTDIKKRDVYDNTATSYSDSRRGFELEITFFNYLQVVITNKYNTIANFHTLQIIPAHAKSFRSDFTSRFPVTDLNSGDSSTAPTMSFLHRLPYN